MDIFEETLALACNADCPRFYQGTCPYRWAEKGSCPRVRCFVQPDVGVEHDDGVEHKDINPQSWN